MECTRCRFVLEDTDLRCPICGAGRKAPPSSATPGGAVVRLSTCTSCGSSVRFDPDHRAPACGYCDAVMQLKEQTDPILETESFLPFTVSIDEAKESLRSWLDAQGWFRPYDLVRKAKLESLKPIWWVGWLVDADILVSWTADTTHDAQQAKWAPAGGQCRVAMKDVVIPATRGLSEEEVQALLKSHRFETREAEPRGPAGAEPELLTRRRSEGIRFLRGALEGRVRAHVVEHELPSKVHRHLDVELLLQGLRTTRLGFPVFVLAYRYRREAYRALVSGQNPDVVHGRAPTSRLKVVLTIGALVMGAAFLLWLLL